MDKYNLGDSYRDKFVVTDDVVNKFAEFSSDFNPIHVDINYAKSRGYSRQVSHGVIQLSYLSKMIGMDFPGPGAMWMNQTVNWLLPVLVEDTIEIILTIKGHSSSTKILTLSVEIFNQHNKKVMEGESQVKLTENLFSQFNKVIDKPIDFGLSQDHNELVTNKHNPAKRVALITGASRGIGEAIARRLSCDGFSVAINCRNDVKSAKKIVDSIISSGEKASDSRGYSLSRSTFMCRLLWLP